MSNSLKTISLFIELHLTVNEVCHSQNLDMKRDLSLGDLKQQKNVYKFHKKKELSNRYQVFF